ncbi:hypothetical protein DZA50_01270 [Kangiella sp. HD9-110m-PIT-SAG07]|nr:hypothetical protein DZA50_01270 [Kangiella sp. HD9-110m-PIT-SAG07]
MSKIYQSKLLWFILIAACFSFIFYFTMPSKIGSDKKVAESKRNNSKENNVPVSQVKTILKVEDEKILKEDKVVEDEQENIEKFTSSNGSDALDNKPKESGVELANSLDALESRYTFEKKDESWSGYWESELGTIILFAGAQAPVKESSVSCKSTICQVSVSFQNKGPNSTVTALSSLSNQFSDNGLKFSPSSIDPGSGKVVFYTKPGEIK